MWLKANTAHQTPPTSNKPFPRGASELVDSPRLMASQVVFILWMFGALWEHPWSRGTFSTGGREPPAVTPNPARSFVKNCMVDMLHFFSGSVTAVHLMTACQLYSTVSMWRTMPQASASRTFTPCCFFSVCYLIHLSPPGHNNHNTSAMALGASSSYSSTWYFTTRVTQL